MIYYWLIAIILAYFFFSLSSLGDKLFLSGKPSPILYTFYASIFGLFMLVFIPFVNFGFPNGATFGWIFLASLARFVGLYFSYVAVKKFEISKIVPSIGAMQPILIFILTWIFFGPQIISTVTIFAFIFLLAGSIMISFEENIQVNKEYLGTTFLVALLASFDFIFSKLAFLSFSLTNPWFTGSKNLFEFSVFMTPFIWMTIIISFFAVLMLLSKNARNEIFSEKIVSDKKNQIIFLGAQLSGGLGGIFYNLSISLAPIAFLAVISSLRGVQYAFLFVLTLVLSVFYSKFFKENLSRKIIIQKISAILLIIFGLILLAVVQ